ncbi:hypothetical protein [Neobacillus muris]|uniref:hypothetical protein n=1 Tax=Neobacillus muris TaxID=2941334 RepID=UPI00203FD2F8|nr:hypothetical protein [Neobacillus muris]
MDIGIIVVWLSLIIYVVVMLKAKIAEKKERKWMYLLVIAALACTILQGYHVHLNGITILLNNTFGRLSRMVVNI